MVVIPDLRRPRQKGHKIQDSLGYTVCNLPQKPANRTEHQKPVAVLQRIIAVVSGDSSRNKHWLSTYFVLDTQRTKRQDLCPGGSETKIVFVCGC